MSHIKNLKCILCGKEYREEEVLYTCPSCGDKGLLDVYYHYDQVKADLSRESLKANSDYSIFRYQPLLPVEKSSEYLPLKVGYTPLSQSERLAKELGFSRLYIKDDGRNPSASFKDRASAIAVLRAKERGINLITCASTGNAAASLSCLSASLGIQNVIFVPQSAPRAKLAQLLIFGAKVLAVKGNYDQAFELSLLATRKWGWYNRSTGINPYLLEGKKTAALEIAEQLDWELPDKVLVSVGDGCIIGGLWKGFYDLTQVGLTDRVPQLIGVQAEGSAVLAKAFWSKKEIEPIVPETIADSISVGIPRAAAQALRGVRESGGDFITVSDEEILEAMKLLALKAGIFGEPAGVTSLAGLIKGKRTGKIKAEEKIVILITGNGLKDIDAAIKAAQAESLLVEPDLAEVEKAVMSLKL